VSGSVPVDLSLLTPLHNEKTWAGRIIRDITSGLDKLSIRYELILSENGSTDGTEKVLKEISSGKENIRVLSIKEADYGASLKKGLQASTGKSVYIFDFDLWQPEFLIKALKLQDSHPRSVIVGNKITGNDFRPARRRAATLLLSKFTGFFFPELKGIDIHGSMLITGITGKKASRRCRRGGDSFKLELLLCLKDDEAEIISVPMNVSEIRSRRTGILRSALSFASGAAAIRAERTRLPGRTS